MLKDEPVPEGYMRYRCSTIRLDKDVGNIFNQKQRGEKYEWKGR
jgi:hypothetical protein